MNFLKGLGAYLVLLIKAVAFGWVNYVVTVVRLLWEMVERQSRRKRLPARLAKVPLSACTPISDPAYKRPDPLIYDQYFLMAQGLAVTWDNPDIQLWRGGAPVASSDLKPSTDYDVVARIWNGSTEAPIVGLPVDFSFLSFGVGTQSHPIGSTTVNLGVKGGPDHPAFATVTWHTPAAPGHYCIQTSFSWADDVNPNNNLGQENTDVVTAHSPAHSRFTLRNGGREREQYRFEADAYVPPPVGPCSSRAPDRADPNRYRGRVAPGTIGRVPRAHDRREYPLPDGWSIAFDPAHPTLAPGTEVEIEVTVEPPAGFAGRQPINVHAFNRQGLAGGVTLAVEAA